MCKATKDAWNQEFTEGSGSSIWEEKEYHLNTALGPK